MDDDSSSYDMELLTLAYGSLSEAIVFQTVG